MSAENSSDEDKKIPVKVMMPKSLRKQVDNYKHSAKHDNRSIALINLIEIGLSKAAE